VEGPIVTVDDYEPIASEKLPCEVFDYYAGAEAVMVGRPIAWGLAAAGEEGAEHVLRILRDAFDLAMALSD